MSVKFFLDADLVLLKLEAQALSNVEVPSPKLGMSLRESMPDLAEQLNDVIQRRFLRQETDTKFVAMSLGDLSMVYAGIVWEFKVWSLLGTVRKGFYIEGAPLTGAAQGAKLLAQQNMDEVQRLQTIVELADLPVLRLDARWHTTYTNDALSRLYGKNLQDQGLHDWLDMFHDDDQADYLEALFQHSKSNAPFQVELRFRDVRGQVFSMLTYNQPVFNSSGMLDSVVVVLLKLSKGSVSKSRSPVLKDALTGLNNRYGFLQILENELKQFFSKSRLAILYVDIDGIKRVNETYGQSASDKLLKALSVRLKTVLRGGDILTRLSDDEFVVLVSDIGDEKECVAIAEKIVAAVGETRIEIEDASASQLTTNVGIRLYTGEEFATVSVISEVDIKKLSSQTLEQSEAAMYQARKAGHNRVAFYSSGMGDGDQQSMELSNALHRAVEMNEFELYYQPLFDLSENRFYGLEGLIRWPGAPWKTERFIQALEDSHLIHRMGRWVIHRSISQFSQLLPLMDRDVEKPILSVNISPIQFYETDLVAYIEDKLKQFSVPPELVTLEITERLLSDNSVDVEGRFREIKQLGLRIALDDFGTGYSSLAYLYRFPIDVIKIDQSFVRDMERYESQRIVESIVNLGRALNKVTLAEGVETKQQMQMLRESQCQVIQGFYYSPVVSYIGLRHFYQNHDEILPKMEVLPPSDSSD